MDNWSIILIIVVSAILVYPLIVRPIMNISQMTREMKKMTIGLALVIQLLADINKKLDEMQDDEMDE